MTQAFLHRDAYTSPSVAVPTAKCREEGAEREAQGVNSSYSLWSTDITLLSARGSYTQKRGLKEQQNVTEFCAMGTNGYTCCLLPVPAVASCLCNLYSSVGHACK